jgi:hypothetical protein
VERCPGECIYLEPDVSVTVAESTDDIVDAETVEG